MCSVCPFVKALITSLQVLTALSNPFFIFDKEASFFVLAFMSRIVPLGCVVILMVWIREAGLNICFPLMYSQHAFRSYQSCMTY